MPQTISIALGAARLTVVGYRVLVLVMSATVLACVVPLALGVEDRKDEHRPNAEDHPAGALGRPAG